MGSTEGSGGGGLLVEEERGATWSETPPCLAACFLWFLSAGHPLMPGGAIDRAERLGAAKLTSPLRVILD